MCKKFRHSGGRRRRRPQYRTWEYGHLVQARFFCILRTNRHLLPSDIIGVAEASPEMDHRGYVDAIVYLGCGLRLYFDIKSSEAALAHRSTIDLSIPFVVHKTDRDETVFNNFVAKVLAEQARVRSVAAGVRADALPHYLPPLAAAPATA